MGSKPPASKAQEKDNNQMVIIKPNTNSTANANTNNNTNMANNKANIKQEVELTFMNTQPNVNQIQNITTPKTYKEYLSKGNYLFQIQNWEGSYINYLKAIELNTKKTYTQTYIDSHYGIIKCLVMMQRIQEAKDSFIKLVNTFPNDCSILINNGLFYIDINEPNKSIELFDKVLHLEPSYAVVYCYKAMTLVKLHSLHEALGCLDKAIEYEECNLEYYVRKALLLTEMEHQEECLNMIEVIEYIIEENKKKKIYDKDEINRAKKAVKTIRIFNAVIMYEGSNCGMSIGNRNANDDVVMSNEVSKVKNIKKRDNEDNQNNEEKGDDVNEDNNNKDKEEDIIEKDSAISDIPKGNYTKKPEYLTSMPIIHEEKKTEENPIESDVDNDNDKEIEKEKDIDNDQEKDKDKERENKIIEPNEEVVKEDKSELNKDIQQHSNSLNTIITTLINEIIEFAISTGQQKLKENQMIIQEPISIVQEIKPSSSQSSKHEEDEVLLKPIEQIEIDYIPIKELRKTDTSYITVINYESALVCRKLYTIPSSLSDNKSEIFNQLELKLQKCTNCNNIPIIYSIKLDNECDTIEVIEEYCDEGSILHFLSKSPIMFTEKVEMIEKLLDALAFLIINEIPFDYNPNHILVKNINNSHIVKMTISSIKAFIHPEEVSLITKDSLYTLLKEIMFLNSSNSKYELTLNELLDTKFDSNSHLKIIEIISDLIPVFDPSKYLDE